MSVVPVSREITIPLSYEQRAVLSMWPAQEEGTAVHLLRIDIEDEIDPGRLRAAVVAATRAHEALGVAIRKVAGYRGLRLLPGAVASPLAWQEADLLASGPAALQPWLERMRSALDVGQGQMLRAGLARTGERSWTLALVVSVLAADRGSLGVLAKDVAAAYRGDGPGDAADTFQYPQYVEWRQDLEQGDEAEAGRAYWRRYLPQAGTLAAPRLAYRKRGAGMLSGASRVRVERALDTALANRIMVAAATAEADAEVLLQAVWWLLMARLTGFDRCVGGWQHDCRRDYEVMQGAVGVFEKVLPLAIDVTGDEPFARWLARLAAVARAHMQMQEYWADDAPRQQAHLAVGFAFHDAPVLAGDRWRVIELPGAMPCFELALQVDWSEHGGSLAVQAHSSLYSQQAVERLLEQYVTLLDGALAWPGRAVSELPWVGAQERARSALRGPVADFGAHPLATRITRWATETPQALAIEASDERLTYGELDARANRMAHWLRAQGVAAGAIVALELPRSSDLLVAMLAAWRAGAGYLPLEPDWPVGRRHAVLADAQPALVLRAAPTDTELLSPCAQALVPDIDLNRFAPTPPAHEASLDDPGYVLYTSGSTGRPKGVVIRQRQLLNYVAAASAAMELGACRRWALTSSVVADLGNTALFCAWFNGACVVVAGRHETEDANAFARFMAERDIDALKMVPSHLDALLECDTPRLPRTLVLGGEAAPGALVERIARLAPGCVVYNHYGPTETTVGVMVHRVAKEGGVPDVLPLTKVLANTRVHVLDAAMQATPAGALGEVYIGGAQLCDGYLNRAADGAIVDDPFEPDARLYRTGDLAHVLPEGGMRLAGRADHQVKIRGFRVEPAEVEAALLAQPGVSQAVVLALPDRAGTVELAAFLIGNEEIASERGRQRLRAQLAALLPAHMLPAQYTCVAAFPRLPNGKIDRLALRALATAGPVDEHRAAPASGDAVEAAIAHCMATLLERPAVGAGDDFFELGGHSLLAIKLAARLRKLFQVELAAGVVFDRRSAASLAAFLRQDPGAAPSIQERAERAIAVVDETMGAAPAHPPVPDPEGIHVVHSRGETMPLFCFPGLFASALEYRAIRKALPPDRPVHSFVCHTLTRARWQSWRLEALAAGYGRYIVETVGRGPVSLLGWSVGGDLAFEVARQLADHGVDLRFVGLLDVMRPTATLLQAQRDSMGGDADGAVHAWMERSAMRARWQALFARLDDEEKLLATAFLREQLISSEPDGDGADAIEYRAWARINHGAMMRRYAWRACPVPAFVWRAERSVIHAREQLRDWRALADVRHEGVVAGCDHRTLLEDDGLARELAGQLLALD